MEKNFDYFVSEFSKLLSGRNASDRDHINRLLDNLNALNYRSYLNFSNDRAVLLVHHCCTLVSPSDTFLVAKCCHLIMNLVSKMNVQIGGKSLSVVVNWCCQSLKSSADVAVLDVLQALHAVINSHGSAIEEVSKDLVLKLSEELENNATLLSPQEVKLWRIRCIHALALSGVVKIQQINLCSKVIFGMLSNDVNLDDFASIKVISSCIETVQAICQGHPEWLSEHLGEVIGITLAFLHCGLPCWKFSPPERLFPIPTPVMPRIGEPKVTSIHGKQKRKALKQGLKSKEKEELKEDSLCNSGTPGASFFNDAHWPTSESDFSDNEGGRSAKIRRAQASIRLAVLNLLLKMSKVCGCKELFGFYTILLGSNGLSYSVVHEPAVRVRGTGIATTMAFISAGKSYFAYAQDSELSSYMPFSGVLAYLLKSLHDHILKALQQNNSTLISTSLLHCSAALIDSTPYHRLHPGLLTPLINKVVTFLNLKERNVSVAVLTCFGAMVSREQITDEFSNILFTKPAIHTINGPTDHGITEPSLVVNKSWLLELFFKIVDDSLSAVQVCVEVWQVICHMARFHFNFLSPHLESVISSLKNTLSSTSDVLQLHAARALEQISTPMATKKDMELECVEMWMLLFRGPLLSILQSTSTLAAAACDCVANIGSNIYNLLPEDLQILIITLLSGCSQHEEPCVRASSIRAIGILLSYPSLLEDEQFIFDACEMIIKLVKDPVVSVRVKSAWALGNLTDCLLKSQYIDICGGRLFEELFEATLTAMHDTENVKVNAVRGLGYLIRLLQPHHMSQPKYKILLEKTVSCLTRLAVTGGNMKLRWNACYALSSLLENESVQGNSLSIWQEPVLNALCSVLVKCNNFKVRVNASVALTNATARHQLGLQYITAWQAVLEGLDNSYNMPDFREFKHQDTLFNQLCINLCNLAKLAELEDLASLHDILVYRMDIAKEQIERFQSTALPEQTSPLLAVRNHIIKLRRNSNNLSHTQSATLSMLSNIFLVQS